MGSIQMDSSVPGDQASLIQGDWGVLQRQNITSATSDDPSILNISDYSPNTLQSWTQTRIKYLVGQSYQPQGMSFQQGDPSAQPYLTSSTARNVGAIQYGFGFGNNTDDDQQVYTIMVNLGAAIYLNAKSSSGVYQVSVANTTVRCNSPRVGLVQIGAGMFIVNQIKTSSPSASANSLLRLAVMMHEARHGDGNGSNAAFPHAVCPSGTTYAGNSACENNYNGPYQVQATMVKNFYYSCSDCTSTEQEGMLRLYGDYAARLLPGAAFSDDTPEALP